MTRLSAEVPISTLREGTKFAMVLEGWGHFYGTKTGKVLYHSTGSTRVRWDGEPKVNEFTDARTGNRVHFVTNGTRDENISRGTLVQVEVQQ